jgi:ZIP family zinc transporter
MILVIAVSTFLSTLLGGFFALHLRDRLHLVLGFSAGAVIGVAFFDLIPEALELGQVYGTATITAVMALGFLVYMTLDRFVIPHAHAHDGEHVSARGVFGAGSLSIHSFLDGMGIGLAFQVSPAVGVVVAVAVLAHDFSDGINTVSMVVKNGGSRAVAIRWLILDAVAPVCGIFVAGFISVAEGTLGLLLALFAGFFLYIGASDLIPESHHAHPAFLTTFMTILGALVLYLIVMFAGI